MHNITILVYNAPSSQLLLNSNYIISCCYYYYYYHRHYTGQPVSRNHQLRLQILLEQNCTARMLTATSAFSSTLPQLQINCTRIAC